MALTLSIWEGDDFYVDDRRVVLKLAMSSKHVVLETDDGQEHDVVFDRMAEIMPDVLVGLGKQTDNRGLMRILIRAPQDMVIMRGELYREQQAAVNVGV